MHSLAHIRRWLLVYLSKIIHWQGMWLMTVVGAIGGCNSPSVNSRGTKWPGAWQVTVVVLHFHHWTVVASNMPGTWKVLHMRQLSELVCVIPLHYTTVLMCNDGKVVTPWWLAIVGDKHMCDDQNRQRNPWAMVIMVPAVVTEYFEWAYIERLQICKNPAPVLLRN